MCDWNKYKKIRSEMNDKREWEKEEKKTFPELIDEHASDIVI